MLSPKTITIMPAAIFMYCNTAPNRKNIEFSKIPNVTKTKLNPRMKLNEVQSSSGMLPVTSVELSCPVFNPTPASMLKYEGISGKTQGDRKESTPAAKTIIIDIFPDIKTFSPIPSLIA